MTSTQLDLACGERVAVRTTLRFVTTSPTTWLDVGEGVTVSLVHLNGNVVRAADVHDGRMLLGGLERQNVVEIACTAEYQQTEGLLKRGDCVVSQFQPQGLRNLHPCFDDPAIRTRTGWVVLTPHGWRAAGPSAMVGEGSDGRTWRFYSPHPLPPHAAGIAAGRWGTLRRRVASIDGRTIALGAHAPPGTPIPPLNHVLGLAADAIAWLEGWLGHPFPMDTWQHVFVSAHPSGALETAGCPSFDAALLMPTSLLRLEELVVHEIVHAWFGNLVGPAGWNDLWFSEGLATYLSLRCLDELLPAGDFLARFDLSDLLRCSDQAVPPFNHPPRPPLAPEDPHDAFDDITYSWAAVLFHSWEQRWVAGGLRRVLGDLLTNNPSDPVDLGRWTSTVETHLGASESEEVRRDLCEDLTVRTVLRKGPLGGLSVKSTAAPPRAHTLARLSEAWMQTRVGDRPVSRALLATADAVRREHLRGRSLTAALAGCLPWLHLGVHYPAVAEGRAALASAALRAAEETGDHEVLHALIALTTSTGEADVHSIVQLFGHNCCLARWAERTISWPSEGVLPNSDEVPIEAVNTHAAKRAVWDSLWGRSSLRTSRVPAVAAALAPLDHETALDPLGERFVDELPAVAALLGSSEARYVLTTLYPWSTHPLRIAQLTRRRLSCSAEVEWPYLRWILARSRAHHAVCGDRAR